MAPDGFERPGGACERSPTFGVKAGTTGHLAKGCGFRTNGTGAVRDATYRQVPAPMAQ
jgi:hypothetical protein